MKHVKIVKEADHYAAKYYDNGKLFETIRCPLKGPYKFANEDFKKEMLLLKTKMSNAGLEE